MNRKKFVKNLLEKLKTHIFASDYMVNCTYVQQTLQYSGGHIYIICTHAMRRRQRWGALTYCEQVKHRTQVLYETQAGVQAGGQLRRTREGTRPRTLEVEKKVKQQTNYLQLTLFINNPN